LKKPSFGANLKSPKPIAITGEKRVARSPAFYFGSVIFFIGLLLLAAGVSKVIAQVFDLLTFAELISGLVLMVVGFRATSSVHRGSL
jgi:hypothetical protein